MSDLTGWTIVQDDGESLLVQSPMGHRLRVTPNQQWRIALEAVLVPTNFISLGACRDYISEVLSVGKYDEESEGDDECVEKYADSKGG